MLGSWPSSCAATISMPDLPRRARGTHFEGTGAQLSDDHERSDAGDESDQSRCTEAGPFPVRGQPCMRPRHRAEWLAKIVEPGVRLRAERLYQQLDALRAFAAGSATRSAGGEPETSCGEIAPSDSFIWVRFVPHCWSRCSRHRIVFVPSDSCGPTADSDSRLTTVANTAM